MPAEPRGRIRLGGIGDEAAGPLPDQLAALRRLGWDAVELRTVDGTAMADLDRGGFRSVADAVAAAGMDVVCLDSRIGDWAHPVTGPFDDDRAELEVLIGQCVALGCRHVRIMSYLDGGLDGPEWRERVLDRIRRLADLAQRHDVVLLHENCTGWAGTDPERALELLARTDSPALRLLFDTGNGVPYGYRAVDMLRELVEWVAHVHVKDAVRAPSGVRYTLPGDGEAGVAECLRLLLRAGWTGVLSIEPHLATQPHLGVRDGDTAAFVRAGERLCELLTAVGRIG